MINHAEKRDFLRMLIDCDLSFSIADNSEKHWGNVINLNSKGILFTSKQEFDPGTILNIVVTPSNAETPPMHARAVVSRVSNNDMLFEIACKIRWITAQPAA